MAKKSLLFSGHRFKGATVANGAVASSGKGLAWKAERPEGFWRSFAELDLSNPVEVAAFVARYGDPLGWMPERSSPVSEWVETQRLLRIAADGYERLDNHGVSRVTDDSARYDYAFHLGLPGPGNLRFSADFEHTGKHGLLPRARDLATFMQMSAVQQLYERTPMKRCVECNNWFALEHASALYCSDACKLTAFRRNKKDAA